MDWNQSTMYEQRVRFILEVQQRTFRPEYAPTSCRRNGKPFPRPRRRRRTLTPDDLRSGFTRPNAVWTVDFKGQFKMRSGPYCYPLTIQDGHSRFLLECQGTVFGTIARARHDACV